MSQFMPSDRLERHLFAGARVAVRLGIRSRKTLKEIIEAAVLLHTIITDVRNLARRPPCVTLSGRAPVSKGEGAPGETPPCIARARGQRHTRRSGASMTAARTSASA